MKLNIKNYLGSIESITRGKQVITDGNSTCWMDTKRGAKVLLVAHVDTVLEPKFIRDTGRTIEAIGLDDRLGVAIADMFFRGGYPVDVLLCDDEEIGQSSGALVDKDVLQKYNSVIELDRAGHDFVDYGLASDSMIEYWEGVRPNDWGSFSDVCSMDLSCSAINLGIGYYKAHDKRSYAIKHEIKWAIDDLKRFIKLHGGTHFPAPPKLKSYQKSYYPAPFVDPLGPTIICPKCSGYGDVEGICIACDGMGTNTTGRYCTICKGNGTTYDMCPKCGGLGYINQD